MPNDRCQVKYFDTCFEKSKVRHLVDFFSTRCRTSDKNKIDQVSDLAVFFDQQSYSTSCHVRRKGFRREVVHRWSAYGGIWIVSPFIN